MDNTLNQNTYISLIASIISGAASKAKGVASISTESGIINKFTSKYGGNFFVNQCIFWLSIA